MFNIGTKVKHRYSSKIKGTILKVINATDLEDVRSQGYRYYVGYDRMVYSVTHDSLVIVETGVLSDYEKRVYSSVLDET